MPPTSHGVWSWMQVVQTVVGGAILAGMLWVGNSVNTIKVDVASLTTKVDFVLSRELETLHQRLDGQEAEIHFLRTQLQDLRKDD